jgi:arylsulfatase
MKLTAATEWRPLARSLAAGPLLALSVSAHAQQKPNMLVIWGDDIGTWNISHNNRGMMGYKTPDIERIPRATRREARRRDD